MELHVHYDPLLRGFNVFRAALFRETPQRRIVGIEAVLKVGPASDDRGHAWLNFRAYESGRETPPDRLAPALIRVGTGDGDGDGSMWRVEPWQWDAKYSLPRGLSIVLTGAPSPWPRSFYG